MSSICIPRLVIRLILEDRLGVWGHVSSVVQRERQMDRPINATIASRPKWLWLGGVIDQIPSKVEIGCVGAPIHCCSRWFPIFH
jgi:hypothetical protein